MFSQVGIISRKAKNEEKNALSFPPIRVLLEPCVSVCAVVSSVPLERIIISLFFGKNFLTRNMMYSFWPDRSIPFFLDQYGPQSCSHHGFCSISVILRLTTHKRSKEEPIILWSHWLVIAICNYWKRGVLHNPRDGTETEWLSSSL